MNFDLDDDQLALQAAALELVGNLANPACVRAFSESAAHYDESLWRSMVAQGWLGVGLPDTEGGTGLGMVELAILAEVIGAHAAPAPFVATVLARRVCERAGLRSVVESLISGDFVACVAWSKSNSSVRAERSSANDDDWFLEGRSDPVAYASAANLAVVVAHSLEGPGVFAVSLDAVRRPAREPAMDLTRPLSWLEFARTPAQRLGGLDAVEQLIDDGAMLTAAEMLGGAQTVLDMTVAYAKDRHQFGKPIWAFQAVKHRCADMLVDVEGMRSTVYWAAWMIGASDRDASIAASTAKCWASDASRRVMASGLQVHGGIGFTWEHDLHFFMKRAQLDQLTFGNARVHRQRLAAHLRPRVQAGESVV